MRRRIPGLHRRPRTRRERIVSRLQTARHEAARSWQRLQRPARRKRAWTGRLHLRSGQQ